MGRLRTTSGLIVAAICASLALSVATARAGEKGGFGSARSAPASSGPSYVTPYVFPGFGGFGGFGFFGGYYSPFIDFSSMHSTHPYLPKYWWAERYPVADPRQVGYNPNAGYPKEEVSTLLLVTYPVKTRVILDGLFIGTSDSLGPIQLPLGMHTLRVEALGFEPSHTVMNIEEPTLQQIEVRLNPKARVAAELQK